MLKALFNRRPDLRQSFVLLMSLVLIVTNVAAYFIYQQNKVLMASRQWVSHTYQVIEEVQSLLIVLVDAETGQRGYLLTGQTAFLEPYRGARSAVVDQLDHLKFLTRDNPVQQKRFTEMTTLVDEQLALLDSRIAERAKPGFVAVDINSVQRSKVLMDELRQHDRAAMAEEKRLLILRLKKEQDSQTAFLATLVASSIVSIIILLLANSLILFTTNKQRKAEENLAETEHDLNETSERLALALQGTSDGIIDWNVKKDTVFYSQRFKEMLGYTNGDFLDTHDSFNTLLHPDDAKSLRDLAQNSFDKHEARYNHTIRLQDKNGSWHWHLVRGLILYDKNNQPYRLIGAHTDITDLKAMETSLRASNKELEEFTYIASHDLRSPLVNLKGFASELEMGVNDLRKAVDAGLPQLNEQERNLANAAIVKDIPMALQFIHSSVQRMDKLTNAILELSRIGRREFKIEKLNTREIVDRCLDSLRHQIDSRKIVVDVEDLPDITADQVSIEQVFGNIIDNAIKYLDPARQGRIRIYGTRGPSETTFFVQDNGRGIAAADMKKIFEIFRRAGDTKDIPGEGMGMAYIKTILRRHGGDIRCMSEPGVGTTFFFTIANAAKKETKNA